LVTSRVRISQLSLFACSVRVAYDTTFLILYRILNLISHELLVFCSILSLSLFLCLLSQSFEHSSTEALGVIESAAISSLSLRRVSRRISTFGLFAVKINCSRRVFRGSLLGSTFVRLGPCRLRCSQHCAGCGVELLGHVE